MADGTAPSHRPCSIGDGYVSPRRPSPAEAPTHGHGCTGPKAVHSFLRPWRNAAMHAPDALPHPDAVSCIPALGCIVVPPPRDAGIHAGRGMTDDGACKSGHLAPPDRSTAWRRSNGFLLAAPGAMHPGCAHFGAGTTAGRLPLRRPELRSPHQRWNPLWSHSASTPCPTVGSPSMATRAAAPGGTDRSSRKTASGW